MIFVAFLALIAQSLALHMYIGGNEEPTCVYITLGRDAQLAEKHSAWELEDTSKKWVRDDTLSIEITIDELFDNNHRVFHDKRRPFADFQFSAKDGGEHKICYRALTDGWWSKSKVKLEVDFAVGTGESISASVGERRLGGLADRVSEVNRKFVHVAREQMLMREREESFRDVSEATNSRVANMTVFQLLALGATCAWQISHLRSFFTKQKLV